jgi:beta-mannosidase
MEQHQKNASGNGLIIAQMTETFRMPKDFPSMVYLSLVLQAEGIRYGVEHWRRHKERVAGTLYWQLNDCWPVASWSSVDYFGRWKALHYAARRFYAPILLSIEDGSTIAPAGALEGQHYPGYLRPPDTLDAERGRGSVQTLYLTSDLGDAWEGEIRWSLETLQGEALDTGLEPVKVAPFASLLVRSLDFSQHLSGERQRELVFVAELLQGGRRLALQVGAFVPTKHLSLADPVITADLRFQDGSLLVDLAAHSLARQVELTLEGAQVVFSDNYFDLPAGRPVSVSCPLIPDWTLDQAHQALKIRSIYDSYEH